MPTTSPLAPPTSQLMGPCSYVVLRAPESTLPQVASAPATLWHQGPQAVPVSPALLGWAGALGSHGEPSLGLLQDVPSLGLSGVFSWSHWGRGFPGGDLGGEVPFPTITPGVPAAELDLTSWLLHGGFLHLRAVLLGRVSVLSPHTGWPPSAPFSPCLCHLRGWPLRSRPAPCPLPSDCFTFGKQAHLSGLQGHRHPDQARRRSLGGPRWSQRDFSKDSCPRLYADPTPASLRSLWGSLLHVTSWGLGSQLLQPTLPWHCPPDSGCATSDPSRPGLG